jgi:hypothetical protein
MICFRRIRKLFLTLAGAIGVATLALPAQAMLLDAAGDFLPTYGGPSNGDLDVTRVDALLSGSNAVELLGTHAAPIGTTPGVAYVWGIDRGAGIEPFPTLIPPTGAGVIFDAVVVLGPDGTGFFLDLILGGAPQFLDPSTITIDGATISVLLSEALLPSQGLAFAEYRYNLWPRYAPSGVDPADNTQISDFAPDASTFTARAVVPEPSGLGLLAGGALALVVMRRRHRSG